jgi:hypothetical protein
VEEARKKIETNEKRVTNLERLTAVNKQAEEYEEKVKTALEDSE